MAHPNLNVDPAKLDPNYDHRFAHKSTLSRRLSEGFERAPDDKPRGDMVLMRRLKPSVVLPPPPNKPLVDEAAPSGPPTEE